MLVLACAVLLGGCMPDREKQIARNEALLREEGIIALEAGNEAPAFSARGTNGTSLVIPEPENGLAVNVLEHNVVLYFYPADNTPNTTRQLKDLTKFSAMLEENDMEIYGVNPGSEGEHQAYARKYSIEVPLLADVNGEIAVAYGCLAAGKQIPQRTLVGIDRNGRIAFFKRGYYTPQQIVAFFDQGAGSANGAEASE